MLRKLKVWLWCFVHLPRVFNLAQLAAVRSSTGEQAIGDIEQRLHNSERRFDHLAKDGEKIDVLMTDYRKLAAGKLELLDIERKEVAGLIEQISKAQKRELAALKRELLFLQRRMATRKDQPSSDASAAVTVSDSGYQDTDAVDLSLSEFLESLSGETRANADDWIARFQMSGAVDDDHPLVHLACKSTWLLNKAMKAGLNAYGTQSNRLAAEAMKGPVVHVENGGEHQDHADMRVRVETADPLAHLASLADESVGGLFASGLLERLSLTDLIRVLNEAQRVLRDGAVIVLQCANPENLQVGARSRPDLTRVRLITPQVLEFLVTDRGFQNVEVIRENPISWDKWLDRKDENSAKLNALLYGPQDYCIVARRT